MAPIKGTFVADFTSFTEGVKKAEVSLDGLEKGAEGAQARLQRMVDSFQGKTIIQQAELATAAVGRIGDVTKLTEAEQQKLNALVTEAIAKYDALGKEAPADMLAIQKATAQVKPPDPGLAQKTFLDLGDSIKSTMLGMVSAQAIISGVSGAVQSLTGFVADSVQSYASAEAAAKKMTVALQNQGTATPETIGHFNDLAAAFQNTTVYSDDLINEMQALLTQVGNVAPAQMEKALTAATDLASGLGIDLQSATMLVAKGLEGNVTSLKKYGVTIDEAALKTQGADAIFQAIQSRFGGQAAAELDTYAGKIKQLANEWDNVKEATGGALAQDPVLLAGLRQLSEALSGTEQQGNLVAAAWRAMKAAIPPAQDLQNLHDDLMGVAEAENAVAEGRRLMDAAAKNAPQPLPDLGIGKRLSEEGAAETKRLIDEWTKQDEAAKKHAETIDALAKRLSGAEATAGLRDLDTVARKLAAGGQLSADTLGRIADQAIQLWNQGGKLTGTLTEMVVESGKLGPAVTPGITSMQGLGIQLEKNTDLLFDWNKNLPGVVDGIRQLGALPQIKIEIPAPPTPTMMQQLFSPAELGKNLSASIVGALQGGGNVIESAAGSIGSSVAGKFANAVKADGTKVFSGALGSVISGALPVLGSLVGPLAGAFWDHFFGSKGRDAVKTFAASFGGFDALHTKLLELGSAGEAMWQKLTQQTGRNDLEGAQQTIKQIQDALSKAPGAIAEGLGYKTKAELEKLAADAKAVYDYMLSSGQYTAAELADAFQKMTDAQQTAIGTTTATITAQQSAAKQAIDELGSKIKGLYDSIKDEAPEEEMGVIERQTREQIRALEAQQAAAQTALQGSLDASAAAAADATTTIGTGLQNNADQWDVWSKRAQGAINAVGAAATGMPLPPTPSGSPTVPGFAQGTGGKYLDFGAGTLAMLHGRERVSKPGEETGGTQHFTIQIGNDVIARAAVRGMPRQFTLQGL